MSTGPTLRSLQASVYRFPLTQPVVTSFGAMRDRPAVFVRAEDSDGLVGWGEVWCNFPSVAAEHRARIVNEVLAPLIVGGARGARGAPSEVFAQLTQRTHVLAIQCGEPGSFAQAIAGIDIALWDLAARRAGEPLWRYLGGTSPDIAVYASGINPGEAEAMVRRKRDEGHRAFKLKIGFGMEVDLANLHALRKTLGPSAMLAVDANQAWSLDQALTCVPQLEGFDLAWLEEPLRADRPPAQWQQLSQATRIPLAGGENMASDEAFRGAIDAGALQVIQPDIAKWGGFSGCLAVASAARARDRRFCPHYLGCGIGLLASAHLLAAVSGDGLLEVDSNDNPLREGLCGPVREVKDGRVTLGAEPGLGAVPDLQAFESYRVPQ